MKRGILFFVMPVFVLTICMTFFHIGCGGDDEQIPSQTNETETFANEGERKECIGIQLRVNYAVEQFYSQKGRYPGNLLELLSDKECFPEGRDKIKCPSGGKYALNTEHQPPLLECSIKEHDRFFYEKENDPLWEWTENI